ncbi:MAG: TonB-dependent receptor plug domain-containing protein, partial [Acidobacteriaceae bacterium]|nr:TonB-dependent receptor plug domain-containing protein [Acidobacteriaceae bacterium]
MRFFLVFEILLTFFVAAASASDLKLKVLDPQGAVVTGAQVTVERPASNGQSSSRSPLAVQNTSAEGLVEFHNLTSEPYRVRVLAKGFASHELDVQSVTELVTVRLKLAPAAETVVVTATRYPVPGELAGSQVEPLSGEELRTMQPAAANDALRFLPGAIVNTAGQRGGLASLFVRGGDSTYNKVIVDGVTINEPGGTFDFGNLPLNDADHLEFLRGSQSTFYGSDAMTSVVQIWTRNGSTPIPELRFGADGGNFGTANGYASLAGAHGRFDYNFFGDQFNTQGQGINDAYSNSLQGANVGFALTNEITLRSRFRHSNSFTGLPGEWDFNGQALESPDPSEHKQLNNFLGSTDLTIIQPSGWQHRFSGF